MMLCFGCGVPDGRSEVPRLLKVYLIFGGDAGSSQSGCDGGDGMGIIAKSHLQFHLLTHPTCFTHQHVTFREKKGFRHPSHARNAAKKIQSGHHRQSHHSQGMTSCPRMYSKAQLTHHQSTYTTPETPAAYPNNAKILN